MSWNKNSLLVSVSSLINQNVSSLWRFWLDVGLIQISIHRLTLRSRLKKYRIPKTHQRHIKRFFFSFWTETGREHSQFVFPSRYFCCCYFCIRTQWPPFLNTSKGYKSHFTVTTQPSYPSICRAENTQTKKMGILGITLNCVYSTTSDLRSVWRVTPS